VATHTFPADEWLSKEKYLALLKSQFGTVNFDLEKRKARDSFRIPR
jgi:hypothetical protein